MKVYKKLFKYVPECRFKIILSILFSALSAGLTVTSYRFLSQCIKAAFFREYSRAIDFSIKTAIFLFIGIILYFIALLISHSVGFRLETNFKKRGIDGIKKSSLRFYDLNPSGKVRKLIDDNSADTHTAVAHLIPDNTSAFLTPIFSIVLAFLISLKVGISLVIFTVITFIILSKMMGNMEFMKLYQKALENMSAETVEYVRSMPVIKIFGTGIKSFKTLYDSIMSYSYLAYKYSKSCQRPYVIYQLVFFSIVPVMIPIIIVTTNYHKNPKMLATELIMMMFLMGVMFAEFMKIMFVSMYFYIANSAIDKLEECYESMTKDSLEFGNDKVFLNHNIEFKNVTFGYNEKNVFRDLSFKLDEGKIYALVGPSGGGKSTLVKLLSGFYKLDKGEISIGNKPITEYSFDAISKNISFVFQNSKLFKKSIYENVSLAKEDATRQEVMNAIKLAGCEEIINKFPNRENTMIGSKGVYLSGGEIQRIAIARAILKNAPIVIMDEASAAIDPDNEHELQKAFKNLLNKKTGIMIAHRLSTIKNVDEIIVMDEGEIKERGTHDELIKNNGLYSNLQRLYSKANEWRIK